MTKYENLFIYNAKNKDSVRILTFLKSFRNDVYKHAGPTESSVVPCKTPKNQLKTIYVMYLSLEIL